MPAKEWLWPSDDDDDDDNDDDNGTYMINHLLLSCPFLSLGIFGLNNYTKTASPFVLSRMYGVEGQLLN